MSPSAERSLKWCLVTHSIVLVTIATLAAPWVYLLASLSGFAAAIFLLIFSAGGLASSDTHEVEKAMALAVFGLAGIAWLSFGSLGAIGIAAWARSVRRLVFVECIALIATPPLLWVLDQLNVLTFLLGPFLG